MARMPRIPRVAASHGGPIVGIDVETACPDHGAVCSIGVSIVLRGEVFRERQWFVDPGTRFDPRFIEIHGITPAMVAGKRRLRAEWSDIHSFIETAVADTRPPTLFEGLEGDPAAAPQGASSFVNPPALVVAHNAQFDRRQIEHAIASPLPFRLACTVAMSRRAFPRLARHNLKTVTEHLRIPLQHHDALSDARACALIAHHCLAAGAAS